MYCLCVNVYCHRVSTQLQLTSISVSVYKFTRLSVCLSCILMHRCMSSYEPTGIRTNLFIMFTHLFVPPLISSIPMQQIRWQCFFGVVTQHFCLGRHHSLLFCSCSAVHQNILCLHEYYGTHITYHKHNSGESVEGGTEKRSTIKFESKVKEERI
jgi:hypothetical protein